MSAEFRDGVAELLAQIGRAHHEAFADTDGVDPEWPIWYADYARDKFADQFGLEFTRSQLIYCFMKADIEHKARSPESNWSDFYADEIVEHCGPSENPAADKLALYYFDGCPFCAMVQREIDELGLDVDLRNIHANSQYFDELVQARGRATVPVLRVTTPEGKHRWMPESRDIISYLDNNYGEDSG
jgi:glutaredoxin